MGGEQLAMRGGSLCFVRADEEGYEHQNSWLTLKFQLLAPGHVLKFIACFLPSKSPASEVYMPTFRTLCLFHLHTYPPMKMEQCSETSVHKIQTPGNNPEASVQHSEHGESLKSRIFNFTFHEGLNSSHSWPVVQCTNLQHIVQWSCYVYCISCLRVAGYLCGIRYGDWKVCAATRCLSTSAYNMLITGRGEALASFRHAYLSSFFLDPEDINPLTPNDDYSGRTAPLTSKRCILYIYSTNIGTQYFKHGIDSPFFPLQNAVCFINLIYLLPVLFTFYIQGVLKLEK